MARILRISIGQMTAAKASDVPCARGTPQERHHRRIRAATRSRGPMMSANYVHFRTEDHNFDDNSPSNRRRLGARSSHPDLPDPSFRRCWVAVLGPLIRVSARPRVSRRESGRADGSAVPHGHPASRLLHLADAAHVRDRGARRRIVRRLDRDRALRIDCRVCRKLAGPLGAPLPHHQRQSCLVKSTLTAVGVFPRIVVVTVRSPNWGCLNVNTRRPSGSS